MKINQVKKYLGVKDTPAKDKTMEDLAIEIGTMVTELRIIRGITQDELAKRVGTKQPSIARLENGSTLPSLRFLYKIARALDTHLLPPRYGLLERPKLAAGMDLTKRLKSISLGANFVRSYNNKS